MVIQVVLYLFLGTGATLALLALGGMSSLLRTTQPKSHGQNSRNEDMQVTIKESGGPGKTFSLPRDLSLADRLSEFPGIEVNFDDQRTAIKTTDNDVVQNNRRPEIIGIGIGTLISFAAALPFLAEGNYLITAVIVVGGLFLTFCGVVIARLRTMYTCPDWKSSTSKDHAGALIDAAFLREHVRHL